LHISPKGARQYTLVRSSIAENEMALTNLAEKKWFDEAANGAEFGTSSIT
jgi:hypothetical protein